MTPSWWPLTAYTLCVGATAVCVARLAARRKLFGYELAAAAIGIALVGTFLRCCMPFVPCGVPLLVAQAEVPGEWRFVVTQSRNVYPGEPFTIALYSQRAGGPWVWHYVDHEDTYWWSGSLRIDREHGTVALLRGIQPMGRFRLATGELYLRGDDEASGSEPITGTPFSPGR